VRSRSLLLAVGIAPERVCHSAPDLTRLRCSHASQSLKPRVPRFRNLSNASILRAPGPNDNRFCIQQGFTSTVATSSYCTIPGTCTCIRRRSGPNHHHDLRDGDCDRDCRRDCRKITQDSCRQCPTTNRLNGHCAAIRGRHDPRRRRCKRIRVATTDRSRGTARILTALFKRDTQGLWTPRQPGERRDTHSRQSDRVSARRRRKRRTQVTGAVTERK